MANDSVDTTDITLQFNRLIRELLRRRASRESAFTKFQFRWKTRWGWRGRSPRHSKRYTKKGTTHRDLKPGNIKITPDGNSTSGWRR